MWDLDSQTRNRARTPCAGSTVLTTGPPQVSPKLYKSNMIPQLCVHAKSFQSCLTLCDAMDCSPLGSSDHGILQARILEWVAISFSRGSSQPRDQILISYVSCIGITFNTSWEAHLNYNGEIKEM